MVRGGEGSGFGRDIDVFELRQDEVVLWTGRPSRIPIALRRVDLVLIPGSLYLLWMTIALAGHPEWERDLGPLAPAATVLLLGWCAYLLAGRFIQNWFRRRNARYAVTTQRSIVRIGREIRDCPHRVITHQSRVRRWGAGTIIFDSGLGRRRPLSAGGFPKWWPEQWLFSGAGLHGIQFWRTADATEVIDLLNTVPHRRTI